MIRAAFFRIRASMRQGGFSLLEIAIVMIIVAILLSTIGVPLAAQVKARRVEETRRILEEAKEALLGFAMANGRFPCPAFATAASNSAGRETFCVAASGTCSGSETLVVQAHGNCSNFYDGFLPAATLGMPGLDSQGFLTDAWGIQTNRVRYVVFGENIGVGTLPFTNSASPSGLQQATISVLGAAATNYLHICSSGTGVTAADCGGTPTNTLTTKAPVLLFSYGANAPSGATGTDESKNTDANKVFVSHLPVEGGANEFDDIATWIPISTIIKKMLDAGKLP